MQVGQRVILSQEHGVIESHRQFLGREGVLAERLDERSWLVKLDDVTGLAESSFKKKYTDRGMIRVNERVIEVLPDE